MRLFKLANAAVVLLLLFSQTAVQAAKSDDADDGVRQYINRLYADRAQLFLTESPESIDGHYQKDISGSRAARNQELRRSQYVRDWAAKRGIQLAAADSTVRIVRIRSDGQSAKVSLVQTLKIAYRYPDVPGPVLEFGVGTRHGLTLKKAGGEWTVFAEWYSDPLDVEPKRIPQESPRLIPRAHEEPVSGKRYDRKRAAAYADKYAGAAWGAGNNYKYNRKYRDYTYLGGDCTNYASQVLGDPEEGGGLKMTGYWRYIPNSGGSHPWVQTDRLKNFLLYSGYARLVAAGTYPEVVKQTAKHPAGAIAKLKLGDLIADEVKGDVDHFSIVTAFDPKGYPLVNSHSADRYHVPFDLGWEDDTRFLLIHIKD